MEGGGERGGVGQPGALFGGQGVVGGDGEGGGGAGEGVADDDFVAAGAEQDPGGGGVKVVVADLIVDDGDVGAELAEEAGFEVADRQFDDDKAQLGEVEEVQDEDVLADVEADPCVSAAPDEGHAVPEDVRVTGELLGESGAGS